MKVGVVGAGAWGTTLASIVSQRAETRLWAREVEVVESVRQDHENRMLLDGFRLLDELFVTNELDQALADVDLILVAVPSKHLRATMTMAQPFVPGGAAIVSVARESSWALVCERRRCSVLCLPATTVSRLEC